jgi:Protein of unknown function (DUF3833)
MNTPTPVSKCSKWLAGLAAAVMSASCATSSPAPYAQETPALDLTQYLNGKLKAHGVFRDRSGKVVRRFVVDMDASWSGQPGQQEGILDETFTYLDQARKGQTDRRIWRLKQLNSAGSVTHYEGQADDVVGLAKGEASGNAFHWQYTLKLPVDGKVWEVHMNDWLYLVDDKVLLNHAVMTKWGLRLGDVQIAFTKEPKGQP